jgi:hypothetical protein
MTEPLTAAVIVSLFFSEAIKEGGKALTKGVTDTFAQVNTIREKFRAEGMEGLLKLLRLLSVGWVVITELLLIILAWVRGRWQVCFLLG